MSRMQEQIGSNKKRKGIRGSKRILGNEKKGSARLLIASLGTEGKNAKVAATRLFRAVSVDNLSIESQH
jgi:hypothetical protein